MQKYIHYNIQKKKVGILLTSLLTADSILSLWDKLDLLPKLPRPMSTSTPIIHHRNWLFSFLVTEIV